MSRQLFYFSVLGLALSACSSHDNKRAQGNFDYAQKQEAKDFVVPEALDKPEKNKKFLIPTTINKQGPIGKKMDIRAPSLVLPIAASSRVITNSDEAVIWFDKVFEDKDLDTMIENAFVSQLTADGVGYERVDATNFTDENLKGTTQVFESQWYHDELETGWLFTDIESSTSMRFRYELYTKPHGRSVSLKVTLIDYMKTDNAGGSKFINPIDKQRAEMSMLNEIVAQLDYNYRLHQQENRLLRANQKLVTLGENSNAEAAYIVEMALDNLWDNMPIFFEKQGFTITDLDESDKKYFVDYIQPDSSLWDSIWGEEQSIIDLADDKYQFVLAPLDDKNQKTSVTIYQADGKPLAKETLERLFSVMELALSFKNIY